MNNTYIFYIFLLVINFFSQAQSNYADGGFDKEAMDKIILESSENNFMGNLSLFQNGVEIYNNSTGYKDRKNETLTDEKTRFRIGSISKIFTAVMIMQLIEENKLDLNSRLSEFIPRVKLSDQITIEQLLSHKSGIFNYTELKNYYDFHSDTLSLQQIVSKFNDKRRKFKPGKKYEYSNSNYLLLTLILEQIEEDTYANILKKRILVPFELSNTYCCNNRYLDDDAKSYYYANNEWFDAENSNLEIASGAGGITSNGYDVNRFLSLLFSNQIISKKSVDLMKPNALSFEYGLGLDPIPFFNIIGTGHSGRIDAFLSYSYYFDQGGLSLTYLSNIYREDINNLLISILSNYYRLDYSDASSYNKYEIGLDDLKRFSGNYIKRKLLSSAKIEIINKYDSTLRIRIFGNGIDEMEFGMNAISKNSFRSELLGIEVIFDVENNILIAQELSKSEYVRYSKRLSPSRDIVDYIRDLFQSPKKIIRFIIGFVVTPFLTSIILKLIFVKISYSTPAFSISPAPSIYWNVVDLIVALWNFVFLFSVPALFILSKMKIAKPWSPWTINMCFCVEYYIALMCMNVTFNLGQSVF